MLTPGRMPCPLEDVFGDGGGYPGKDLILNVSQCWTDVLEQSQARGEGIRESRFGSVFLAGVTGRPAWNWEFWFSVWLDERRLE